MRRLLLALVLVATPVLAQDAPPRDEFAIWAKERIAQLEQQVQQLQQKVDELSSQSKPVVQSMRERFEEDRPKLEAAGKTFWEKVKSAASILAEDIRQFFDGDQKG
jgi:DNA repair exonuclease SbcCD ATPase subunit